MPRQEVWASIKRKGASEKYVRVIQDMYEGSRTRVRTSVGTTEEFGVRVGSSLSPYLFNLLMDDCPKYKGGGTVDHVVRG